MRYLEIPDIKFHGLRHSFATRCIESNCDYKTVSVLLGHSNISTTLNLYVHPNLEQKKKQLTKCLKHSNNCTHHILFIKFEGTIKILSDFLCLTKFL